MARKKKSGNWIAGAIERPGALTRKAKKAGMSPMSYAKKVTKPGSRASGRTKLQGSLAKTLRTFPRKKKG